MPELVVHLTQFLDYRSLSRLMRTNQRMHMLCTPSHYYNVQACFQPRKRNLLGSAESIQAFARNINRVRQINLWTHDIVYYVNCVFAFQDLLATQTTITTEHPSLSRPSWLAPPDRHICTVLPIPPMTLLTKLELTFVEQYEFMVCPYGLPSCRNPKANITQACWIINSNPHLLDLDLSGFIIKDRRDVRLLATAIYGLKRLQTLSVEVTRWDSSTGIQIPHVGSDVLFACSSTIQILEIMAYEDDMTFSSIFPDEYTRLLPGTPQSWEKSDEECGLTTTPRRQEPLAHLKELLIGDLHEDVTETGLRSMLQACPNLVTLEMPLVPEISNIQRLAADITQSCPKLRELILGVHGARGTSTRELMLRTMAILPAQQVTRFYCNNATPYTIHGLNEVGSIFRRHSGTLRGIMLDGCRNINSKAIQAILVACGVLEELDVQWTTEANHQQLCIDLDDAIEFQWTCMRIQRLRLTVAIPDEPLRHLIGDTVPYYDRPFPTTLSTAETQQFQSLSTLYRRVGALTELRRLDLRAIFYDRNDNRAVSGDYKTSSFPALLSLGCEKTDRIGYLHLLSGLNHLEELFGSVSATTEETRNTIGVNEVAWMEYHWPALRSAEFFTDKSDIMGPFKWLLQQRREWEMNLLARV
ncbi:hypothetical protein BGX24_008640 [Mortierella sp. AD032]|nr:hypothetical protein BGX24_008640 [Mortierella sp. AD032]